MLLTSSAFGLALQCLIHMLQLPRLAANRTSTSLQWTASPRISTTGLIGIATVSDSSRWRSAGSLYEQHLAVRPSATCRTHIRPRPRSQPGQSALRRTSHTFVANAQIVACWHQHRDPHRQFLQRAHRHNTHRPVGDWETAATVRQPHAECRKTCHRPIATSPLLPQDHVFRHGCG